MSFGTYSELLDSIKRYADTDKNPKWLAALPGFPALVEAKVRKRLRIGEQERTAQITTIDTKDTYSPPPRYQSLRLIQYQPPAIDGVQGKSCVLRYLAPDTLVDMSVNWTGSVEHYTIQDGQFKLLGSPATAGMLKIVYIEGLEPLSTATPTNWLLTDYPDVYLSGCMVESVKFQKGDQMQAGKAEWEREFETELGALIDADKHDRWSGPPRQRHVERW